MAAEDIVIVGAARTAVGSFGGAFNTVPAHELGAIAIKAALDRAGVSPDDVDEVIFGQVLTAGAGQNPARRPPSRPASPRRPPPGASTRSCGSGLRTVALGMQQIANGDATVIVAGGQESMSLSPHAQYLRGGQKMGDVKLVDTMIKDGLWTPSTATTWAPPPRTWPRPSSSPASSRTSSRRSRRTRPRPPQGRPLQGRDRPRHRPRAQGDTIVDTDEYIRDGATVEAMAKLKPASRRTAP